MHADEHAEDADDHRGERQQQQEADEVLFGRWKRGEGRDSPEGLDRGFVQGRLIDVGASEHADAEVAEAAGDRFVVEADDEVIRGPAVGAEVPVGGARREPVAIGPVLRTDVGFGPVVNGRRCVGVEGNARDHASRDASAAAEGHEEPAAARVVAAVPQAIQCAAGPFRIAHREFLHVIVEGAKLIHRRADVFGLLASQF